ncbi:MULTISPECIES: hypothetical protein, partial [unclassified Bradyrhizobium]|uniref:hypothetical protein n=1 Tax=unclassified Bradyrhizobium TaxID=2631580 RepID=UPI0028EAF214
SASSIPPKESLENHNSRAAFSHSQGQGRLRLVGWWHSRCAFSFGNNPSVPGLAFRASKRHGKPNLIKKEAAN